MLKRIPLSGRLLMAALCLLVLASGAVVASSPAAESLLKIDLDGVVHRSAGDVPLDQAGKVFPGEVLTWSMKVTNRGDSPAPSASADGEIHPATVYVPGSAHADGGAVVTFSIDGGRTFSARPMETYIENGVEKKRPAPVEAYRVVRFSWPGQISPGEVRSASYNARVR